LAAKLYFLLKYKLYDDLCDIFAILKPNLRVPRATKQLLRIKS
jgi:hypothetical protein